VTARETDPSSGRAPAPVVPASVTPVHAMSVDVEEHYHAWALSSAVPRPSWGEQPSRVCATTRRVLDLFAETGAKATFFVLGSVARQHPDLVRAIVAEGHELGSHGLDHYRVSEQTPAQFFEDVRRSRLILEDAGGVPVRGYRAANFSIGKAQWWAFDRLGAAGYEYSSSVHPIRHDHYGIPDAPRWPFRPGAESPLVEYPVATIDFAGRRITCAGGGFFRLLPYGWSRWCLDRLSREDGSPGIFYFHPWEIDPDQPRARGLPLRSALRHYVNLGRMEAKLRRLLRAARWDRIDRVMPRHAPAPGLWAPQPV
jgi:polysaccharide deacetylase family protein (PEP-CTERM system associated)